MAMDVVVRTPHGDADIDIVAAPASTTLADLLRAVTGQAAPAATRVDGRVVATDRGLADLDLVIGSLIDTRPESATDHPTGPDEDAVGIVQLTGRGAGTTVRLHRGRFRVGSARRLHAGELEQAAVETPAFDVEVGANGVQLTPGPDVGGVLGVYAPTLGREIFDRKRPWTGERLSVGGRLFDIDVPFRTNERRRLAAPNDDGSIPFRRTAGGASGRRRVLVDALEDAMSGTGGLWARRATDVGAYDVAYGFHADATTIASVDLQQHRGVALVGSDRFTSALARTMLVELATQHGPADLDIAIASTPDHVAQWSWARWLPHVRRTGPSSPPDLFDDSSALATWASSMRHPDESEGSGRPTTLLVLDDISLWSQRDSPVRSLLVDPPAELRIMALCVGLHEAPGMCTSLIEEVPPIDRLAHLTSGTASSGVGRPALFGSMATQHTRTADAPHVVTDIHPALAEIPLAADIARTLAPLDDLDAQYESNASHAAAPTLTELVEVAGADAPPSADVPVATLSVPIGMRVPETGKHTGRSPVSVDLTAPLSTILVCPDEGRHDRTVATLLLAAATQRRPDELAILTISHRRPEWHDDLPHIAGWAGREDANDASRLIHRVAHVLTEQPDLHVLVVIERAFAETDAMPIELVNAMTELAESLPNVHAVLTGDHPDSVPDANRARCGSLAWVGDDGFGRLWIGNRQISFQGIEPPSAAEAATGPSSLDAPELIIRPTTQGRAMTPLERRLARTSPNMSNADDDLLRTAAVARRVTARTVDKLAVHTGPSLLPPPLPVSIGLATLLERHAGDAVPIGLVDRPERAENEAYWWQPGSGGSILAAGSPRSGMTSLVDLILCGVAARISADDLHLYAIESLPQRRRAFDALPHTGSVALSEEAGSVRQLVSGLHATYSDRMATQSDTDRPNLLLLIGDVSRMVRSLPEDSAAETMRQLGDLAASGPTVGINVVAIASRLDDLGALNRLTGDRLVGSTTDPADRATLGAPAAGATDLHPGRCWSTTADRRVQLATPPAAIDTEILRLAPEAAETRPPVAFTARTSP